MISKTCEQCHKEFGSVKNKIRFCTRDCWKQYEKQNAKVKSKTCPPKICEICSKEYTTKYINQRFCSLSCSSKRKGIKKGKKRYLTIPDCLAHADRKLDKNLGYVRVYVGKSYPGANNWGYAYEHRVVMEVKLGRYLNHDEHVHHINHCRWDNRPENLVVLSNVEHGRLTKEENTIGYDIQNIENNDFSQQIIDYLTKSGALKRKQNTCKYKQPAKEKLVELSTQYSMNEIARQLQVSYKVISRWYKLYNIQANKYTSNKPPKETLEELVKQFPVTHIAKQYNVSDNAVKKWCKSYGIQNRPRGYWTKLKYNKDNIAN